MHYFRSPNDLLPSLAVHNDGKARRPAPGVEFEGDRLRLLGNRLLEDDSERIPTKHRSMALAKHLPSTCRMAWHKRLSVFIYDENVPHWSLPTSLLTEVKFPSTMLSGLVVPKALAYPLSMFNRWRQSFRLGRHPKVS